MRIRFTIPGKPMPLERARATVTPRGKIRMYTPEASVKYQELIRRTAVLAGCPLFAKGCRLALVIYFPDRRVRDADNVLKGVADSLQANKRLNRRAIAWRNDHDIGHLSVERAVDRERPRVEVTIDGDVLKQS